MWFESVLHHSLNLYLTNQYCACPTISHILHLDQKFSVMHLWLYQIHLQTLVQQGSHSKPGNKNCTKGDLEIMAQLTPIKVNIMHNKCTTRVKTHNLFTVDENSLEQCCAAHIVQCCQQYCSALLHLIAG